MKSVFPVQSIADELGFESCEECVNWMTSTTATLQYTDDTKAMIDWTKTELPF